ncbi:hypothetical protein HWV62_23434 [Athelia sp. TMB]|nr:hypothetical protein HWV62_23434 [Athelia sp. TMB]
MTAVFTDTDWTLSAHDAMFLAPQAITLALSLERGIYKIVCTLLHPLSSSTRYLSECHELCCQSHADAQLAPPSLTAAVCAYFALAQPLRLSNIATLLRLGPAWDPSLACLSGVDYE